MSQNAPPDDSIAAQVQMVKDYLAKAFEKHIGDPVTIGTIRAVVLNSLASCPGLLQHPSENLMSLLVLMLIGDVDGTKPNLRMMTEMLSDQELSAFGDNPPNQVLLLEKLRRSGVVIDYSCEWVSQHDLNTTLQLKEPVKRVYGLYSVPKQTGCAFSEQCNPATADGGDDVPDEQ